MSHETSTADSGNVPADPPAREATSEVPTERSRLLTDDEVQAVAPGTVIRGRDGTIAARFWDLEHGVLFGDDRPFAWTAIKAPAVVLWGPGDEDAEASR